MRKRLESINELESLLKNRNNYIFYLDTAEECDKYLEDRYKTSSYIEKKKYCGGVIDYPIKIYDVHSEYITVNDWVFGYKNLSYIEKEIEIILDVKI